MSTAMLDGHMDLVRREYDLTVVDHSYEDGCDECTRGLDPRRPSGWEFDRTTNTLLCGPCVFENSRLRAQIDAALKREKCRNGHDMRDEANQYVAKNGHGLTTVRCRRCYLDGQSYRKRAARLARKAAAQNGGAA